MMKKTRVFLFISFFLLLLSHVFSLSGCGGGAAPPASIPAPVANLMTASPPDSTGAVTINGAPGAIPTPVQSGAAVQANNCNHTTCSLWKKIFLRPALAQTFTAEVPVNPDGSFNNLRVDVVQPNDIIGLRQVVGAEFSQTTAIAVPCGGTFPPCVATIP
ncbi:MAG: hypothetical protein U1F57_02955 [bacterium]